MGKVLFKGNEALAEAALAAGCRFYSGYPITPQTEILEYLSWRMEDVGGVFIQAESELAGVNMVLGASAAGARALTTSAGPGFSLKQEGISYLVAADLPAVIRRTRTLWWKPLIWLKNTAIRFSSPPTRPSAR